MILHCMLCTAPLDEKRSKRARFCLECARTVNRQKRAEMAGKKCRLCKRRFYQKKEILEPVRTPHIDTEELLERITPKQEGD